MNRCGNSHKTKPRGTYDADSTSSSSVKRELLSSWSKLVELWVLADGAGALEEEEVVVLFVGLLSVESLSAASPILLLFRFAWPGMSLRMPLEPDLLLSSRLDFLLRSLEGMSLVESIDLRRARVLLFSLPGS
jgi:hypothetical protein